MRPGPNEELADFVRAWVARNLPGAVPEAVTILIRGSPVAFQLPVSCAPLLPATSQEAFAPSAPQDAILDALAGKALRTDALLQAAKISRAQLFHKPKGGIEELKEQGLVRLHGRLGYYRPDEPPDELAGES